MSKTETQSEALRIAEEFEACGILDAIPSINEICQAALELRRLDAENKALRERLEAVEMDVVEVGMGGSVISDSARYKVEYALQQVRAAQAAAKGADAA